MKKSYKWLFWMLLPLMTIAAYLGYQHYGKKLPKNWYQPKPVLLDTPLVSNNSISSVDTLEKIQLDTFSIKSDLPKADTLVIQDTLVLENIDESPDSLLENIASSEEINLEQVELAVDTLVKDTSTTENTTVVNEIIKDTIQQEVIESLPSETAISTPQSDFFDSALFPKNVEAKELQAFLPYYEQLTLSNKTLLKFAMSAGKLALTDVAVAEELLNIIEEEDSVLGILVCDKAGTIAYSTDKKYKNHQINDLLPSIKIENPQLHWSLYEDQIITDLPLFHHYGIIGRVILRTQKDIN